MGVKPMATNKGLDDQALKSDLEWAIESNETDAIESLSKSETIYYVCHLLNVPFPVDENDETMHPSQYSGAISRGKLQEFARVLGDYVDRNGSEAFHADSVLQETDESDESDDSDDSEGE